jgi:hypothetical protein
MGEFGIEHCIHFTIYFLISYLWRGGRIAEIFRFRAYLVIKITIKM